MRKNTITLFLLCFSLVAWSQEQDSVTTASIPGNIYKPMKVEATDARVGGLNLPSGFKISKFAEGLGEPRMLVVGSQGNVYVTRRAGEVLRLKDSNNDGKADEQETVITKDQAHGMAIHENKFYLITVNEVYRGDLNEDGSIGELEEIISDLPDGGQHPNRTMAFGPDGMMYISVGSTCNACPETREESATMVIANPDGSERRIFAKGLRNTIGFDWHPETNEFFGMDHGMDWLGNDEPHEELNKLEEGEKYGWPYIYDNGKINKSEDKPPHSTWEEYAAESKNPEMMFTAHSAPMDFKFYEGDMFPSEYKNSALVTFHGSWNRDTPSGYKMMKVTFENGEPTASEDFITGWISEDDRSQFGRVVGLAEMEDGSVLVSDDSNGVIYRISYEEQ